MSRPEADHHRMRERMRSRVAAAETRKLRARRERERSIWFGLGMFGLVGWSVAVPAVLGALLGLWLDTRWPVGQWSWTLMLLFLGVVIGCANAWNWIQREGGVQAFRRDRDSGTETTVEQEDSATASSPGASSATDVHAESDSKKPGT